MFKIQVFYTTRSLFFPIIPEYKNVVKNTTFHPSIYRLIIAIIKNRCKKINKNHFFDHFYEAAKRLTTIFLVHYNFSRFIIKAQKPENTLPTKNIHWKPKIFTKNPKKRSRKVQKTTKKYIKIIQKSCWHKHLSAIL